MYGDDLSTVRPMVVEANRLKTQIVGFETGKHGCDYRVVEPIHDHRGYLGLIEIGVSVSGVISAMSTLDQSKTVMLLNEQAASVISDDHATHRFGSYRIIYGTPSLLGHLKSDNNFTQDTILKIDDHHYAAHFKKIKAFDGTEIGILVCFQELSSLYKNINDLTLFVALATIAMLALALLTVHATFGTMIDKIEQLNRELEKELDAKTDAFEDERNLLREYKVAVDASAIVSKTDPTGIITYVNDAFCAISGYSRHELIGKQHNIVHHPQMEKKVFDELWKTISSKKIWKGTIQNRRKDGTSYFVSSTIVPILDRRGDIIEYIAIRYDITELITKRAMLETDELTGLASRYKLFKELATNQEGAIALINIDGFRSVNDFYGTEAGDYLLIELARRLEGRAMGRMAIYRLFGDEFALRDLGMCDHFLETALEIIRSTFSEPFLYNNNRIVMTATVGFSGPVGERIKLADYALKRAREEKRDFYLCSNEEERRHQLEKNIHWAAKIRAALAEGRIIPWFQPIIDASTGKVVKYESLVRLIDDDGRAISPFFFLDIAKKIRLYPQITMAVLDRSIGLFRERGEPFSINLSFEDIAHEETADYIKRRIREEGIGERVVFEILESEGIENFDAVQKFIEEIKELGCKIALDDFGSGYSNFENVLKLQIDILKIDATLIKTIDTNANVRMITETIVSFAKRLNITTVAEFVHSEQVWNQVKMIGIDEGQGFYLGQPAPSPLPISRS
ncbi:MAG: EAL domain-containing protein [Campylobacterales bacterium]